jgi:hypothetical protein
MGDFFLGTSQNNLSGDWESVPLSQSKYNLKKREQTSKNVPVLMTRIRLIPIR